VALPDREMAGVLRLANLVRDAGIVGAVVLLGAALVVVSNTIRISVFGRRREIKIMQLVGATAWFIRLPLLIEGLLHGLGGGALAGICLFAGGHYAARLIRETVPMLVPYGGSVDLPASALRWWPWAR
jgi:cell division transport system permease protein